MWHTDVRTTPFLFHIVYTCYGFNIWKVLVRQNVSELRIAYGDLKCHQIQAQNEGRFILVQARDSNFANHQLSRSSCLDILTFKFIYLNIHCNLHFRQIKVNVIGTTVSIE